jgi:hypothetical protein
MRHFFTYFSEEHNMVASSYHLSRLLDTETWINKLIAQAWVERDDLRVRHMKKLRLMVKDAVLNLSARPVRQRAVKGVGCDEAEIGREDTSYLGRL